MALTRSVTSEDIELPDRAAMTPRSGLPFHAVLGLISGLAFLVATAYQMRDIDLYWHIRAGAEIMAGTPIDELGTSWSFAPDPAPWTSTQWLAEVLLHVAHHWGSWAAVAGLRVLTAIAAIAVLARTTLRGRPAALAGLPFLLGVTVIVYASQERPQQATLIGAALLGGVLADGLTRDRLPRWYVLLPATILWANFHGGWILVPVVLGIIAVGRALDHGLHDRLVWRAGMLSAASAVSGLISPAGIGGLTATFRFKAATGVILEWQSTEPLHPYGVLTVVMLSLAIIGWVRSARVPLSEALAVGACLLFSWTAWRNVAPGLAIAAPMVAHRLTMAFPGVRRAEPRWSTTAGLVIASALAILSLGSLIGREHLPVSSEPIRLAKQITELPAGQRVLNDYNAAGMVLFFGGEGTRVGIDGRADRYGARYIEDYIGLRTLKGDWEQMLDQLDPTSALFKEEMAIVHVLQAERGWMVIGRENGWVLLVPGD